MKQHTRKFGENPTIINRVTLSKCNLTVFLAIKLFEIIKSYLSISLVILINLAITDILGTICFLHQCYKSLQDFFLFSDLKRILDGKKFSADEDVIAETENHFEAKDKSYYKICIEKLYDRYYRCIELVGNYIE